MRIADATFTSGVWPEPFPCDVVVRYRGVPAPAMVIPDSEQERTVEVDFGTECGPVASAGQAIVFYQGDEVLGGGTIHGVERLESLERSVRSSMS